MALAILVQGSSSAILPIWFPFASLVTPAQLPPSHVSLPNGIVLLAPLPLIATKFLLFRVINAWPHPFCVFSLIDTGINIHFGDLCLDLAFCVPSIPLHRNLQ